MKAVIVTGATGFIGSSLVKELISQKIFVYAIVRKKIQSNEILPISSPLLEQVECDINTLSSLENLFKYKKIQTLYHLAWAGVSNKDQSNYHTQLKNIENTLNIIDMAAKYNVKKFIGAGSIHEWEGLIESKGKNPVTNLGLMYKTSKLAAHNMGRALANSKGLQFFWPIITNAYGPGEDSKRLINITLKTLLKNEPMALTSGEQLYDFVYVTDVAKAFRLIGENGKEGETYIISSGNPQPLKVYLKKIGDIFKKPSLLQFNAVNFSGVSLPLKAFDNSALIRDTGFHASIPFEQGITSTILHLKKTSDSLSN